MGKTSALLCASAMLLCVAGGSSLAADLPSPPPPPMEPTPAPEFSGWYIRGDVGVGSSLLKLRRSYGDSSFDPNSPDHDVHRSNTSLDDSVSLGGGVGYQFNNWLRTDVTAEYRTSATAHWNESYMNTDYSGSGYGSCGVAPYSMSNGALTATGSADAVYRCNDHYTANVQSSVLLWNGYVDLGTWYNFTPYIGGGVGGSYNHINGLTDQGNNGGFGEANRKGDWDFAWALMTGVAYDINKNLKLEMGYRFLDMGEVKSNPIQCNTSSGCPMERHKLRLASNDIRIGMRWLFNPEPAPVAWEQPITRRY